MSILEALLIAVAIVAYIAAWWYAFLLGLDKEQWKKAITIAVLLIAMAVWGIGYATTHWDNATHCGPGTTYRESSRYSPAQKRVVTDWVCEAN